MTLTNPSSDVIPPAESEKSGREQQTHDNCFVPMLAARTATISVATDRTEPRKGELPPLTCNAFLLEALLGWALPPPATPR